jgi:hypothetical protein
MKRDSVPDPKTAGREEGMMSAPEPVACFQSSRTDLKCRICGEWPSFVHFPIRQIGAFCAKCCPACNPKPVAKG